jgi:excisionase family DNA binding protein
MPESDLLTAAELAKRLQVTPDTVREWTRRGTIPRLRLSAKVIRYDLRRVLEALATREGGARGE